MSALEMYCVTDLGAVRSNNEDCVAIFPQLNLVVLADGMGGHNAGEIASRRAIEVVRDVVRDGVELKSAVARANYEVYQLASKHASLSGMGTTLVAALYEGNKTTIACVGDSRLYCFRRNSLRQVTVDQTLAQEMRDNHEEFKNGKHISECEHVLTNALGIRPECEPVMQSVEVLAGDIHLLCSDGLTGVLDDNYIEASLRQSIGSQEGVLHSMIDAALRRAAPDNISIALAVNREGQTVREVGKAPNKKLGLVDSWNL